ncbi:polyketide cyclase [Caenimonas sedimenti]|uniref:Polyketide cyclase n=1 Tax=Caenimonas sedimenti TaxID=2596921 RepID=A0A562ZQ88_9BURK|nr:SRPBCC family protein [Caenimonas sedimenti]TWO70567.1 polyketide cyclase [Caenimonas sedimenti]
MQPPPIAFSIHISASPEAVYEVYADVPGWPRWDPDTRAAGLDGSLQAGARGWLRPRKGLKVAMHVAEATPGRSFTVECPVLGSRMRFGHELVPAAGGVQVTHSASFHGWLAGWLDRTVGRDVRAGLPATLVSLKAHVEQGGAGR